MMKDKRASIRSASRGNCKRVSMLMGASVACLLLTQEAAAQSADVAPPTAAEDGGEAGLPDIVVLARKREENLQSTPVSVSVISGSDAAELNIRDFRDLRGVVTDLEIMPLSSGGTSIAIRGVGQTSAQVNVDAKSGFYVDEMYVARQEGNSLHFYDVANVQVLKGPQGTLFGKNTTAGALLLTTTRPGQDVGGYVQLRLGNYDRIDTEGAFNLPLSETVFTRLSFRTQNAKGYIKHVLDDVRNNNTNDQSARFQVRYQPDSSLTADFLAEYNKSSTNGSAYIMTGCDPNGYYIQNYNALHSVPYCNAYPVLNKDYTVYGGATLSIPTSSLITDIAKGGDYVAGGLSRGGRRGSFNDTEVVTLNMRLNYDINDDMAIRSITTYRNSQAQWYNPTVNAPIDIYAELSDTETTQWSQEFNLTGKAFDGRLDYVLGLYFSDQKTTFLQDTGPDWVDPVGYTFDASNRFKSWAAYAQASFKITPELELTLGGRYTHDKKDAASEVFFQTVYAPPCDTFLNAFIQGSAVCGGTVTGADGRSWSSFDPRAQLSYQWTPDLFTYVSVTRGYNAGGFNQQISQSFGGGLISYDPEKLISYEAGFKSQWLDRRLRINVSAFYQKYKDIQTQVAISFNGVITRQVQSGATAHEQGVEGEVTFQPIPDLTLRANAAYLHQAYDSVRPGVSFTVDTPVSTAPKFTYSVAGNYVFHVGEEATLTTSLNWRWVGKKAACNAYNFCPNLPAYGLLGGRIDFQPSEESRWQFSIWGTNLLDKLYRLERIDYDTPSYTPGRPLEAGVEVSLRF